MLDDGDDDAWLEGGLPKSALEELNLKYCCVIEGGRFRVAQCEFDNELQRRIWTKIPRNDFIAIYANRFVERGEGEKPIPLGTAWLSWPKRNTAKGYTFDTDAAPGKVTETGLLNLWTGWGLKPKQGEWKRFERMIRKVLAAGNEEYAEYILNWIAWVIQNPDKRPEVVIVFKGAKGLGKGTLGELLAVIFGAHGIVLSQREQLTGRFTGHMAGVCFIFADEAVWGGYRDDIGPINKIITDKLTPVEKKGVDLYMGVNRVALMMATNADWAVPASFEERRFAVFEPDRSYFAPPNDPDHKNRKFWNAVYAELNRGGREAFFHAMLNRPLGNWHPRNNVPQTAAHATQVLEGLKPIERWWFERVQSGEFPSEELADQPDWSEWQYVKSDIVLKDYDDWRRHNMPERARHAVAKKGLIIELQRMGWINDRSKRLWSCPPLSEARAHLRARFGGYDLFDEDSE